MEAYSRGGGKPGTASPAIGPFNPTIVRKPLDVEEAPIGRIEKDIAGLRSLGAEITIQTQRRTGNLPISRTIGAVE